MSTCANASRAAAEPLPGTAATAGTWLLIEQPGPWGARALTDSRLDPGVGRALGAWDAAGVRAALIRRPGRDGAAEERRAGRVFLAHTAPGNAWIRALCPADPRELLALDPARLGAGHHDGVGEPYRGAPLVLVCTNGRRDRCCAVLGRPLAAEAAAAGGASVWEVTHLGGHRFAPTLLVLPHGYAYGWMTAVAVKDVVSAVQDGRVVTERCRGRSAWDRAGQAAELAVRALTGEDGADALTVAGGPRPTVSHRDGRAWRVTVARTEPGPPVPASCGADPEPQTRFEVTAVEPLGPR
ncbi:sucrase ferredoxin [Streptomyces sp. DSM 44917]|uniref:Sucrase ferredoxin n=1 Tax=Streptomyces boetiae TaxID=3075541 RepID=A0ABU2L2A1_9ACTN|nr:sucrase ferredoxin [Streptomyces sp. DSM 44917]MDT0305640.1 sucrase ferredoxin [Streptomyces sp. DSM 44917]